MAKLPECVVTFAQNDENLKTYEKMRDYYNHYCFATMNKTVGDFDASVTLSEKEDKMNKALISEVERVGGVSKVEGISFEAWSTNPTVKWATFAVVNAMIDAIIPDTVIRDLGLFCEMKQVGYGEVAEFELAPNGLFAVTEAGNAIRRSFNKKQFNVSKTLQAINHQVTVEVALYKVLAGKESLAKFVNKAILSIERQMSFDAYDALNNLVTNGSFPASLKKAGYTVPDLIELCQKVEAYNNGARVAILGTKKALYNVLPNTAVGYHINTDVDNIKIRLIKDFLEYDIVELSQVATGSNYGLKLHDDKLYVMAMNGDKLIKMVIEGSTITNIDQASDNADLTQHATLNKRWGVGVITNSAMGCMTLS